MCKLPKVGRSKPYRFRRVWVTSSRKYCKHLWMRFAELQATTALTPSVNLAPACRRAGRVYIRQGGWFAVRPLFAPSRTRFWIKLPAI